MSDPNAQETMPIAMGANGLHYRSRYRLARKGQWYRVEEWRRLLWIGPFGWRVAHRADGFLDETPHPDQMRTRLRVLRCNEAHERATWQPVADEAADPVGDEAQGS